MKHTPLSALVTALAALFFAPPLQAQSPDRLLTIEGREVAAWLPTSLDGAPVILFSHGFHGCATQSTFLMTRLQRAGYAVFAPQHADAACLDPKKAMERPTVPFRMVERWNDTTYADRRDDMKALLDALPKDERFAGLDWTKIGLAGHSLGGYTVMGLGGGWKSWKDARVDAVLALSPYAAPYIQKRTLQGMAAPIMYQGGTNDPGITPSIGKGGGAYAQTPAPKFYVEFQDAHHYAWSDRTDDPDHEAIADYSVAFFDHVLKGKPVPISWGKPDPNIADWRAEE